jgi:hypothetical protein
LKTVAAFNGGCDAKLCGVTATSKLLFDVRTRT